LLRPVIAFVVVTGLISAFQMFTLVHVLTQGGPSRSTDVIVYHVYQTAFGSQALGMASAMGLLLLIVLLLLRWPQLKLLGRQVRNV
jgi:multiple sugar transport system permease protein